MVAKAKIINKLSEEERQVLINEIVEDSKQQSIVNKIVEEASQSLSREIDNEILWNLHKELWPEWHVLVLGFTWIPRFDFLTWCSSTFDSTSYICNEMLDAYHNRNVRFEVMFKNEKDLLLAKLKWYDYLL